VNERRHFSRVAFDADAVLTTTADRLAVKVVDLSLKGALLRLCAPVPVAAGTPCLVEVMLGEARVAMAAEVAHVKGELMGVLCRSIDLESITHLRRLIEVNLGDPRLAERELKSLVSA
jgi:hypothetical protein